MAFDKFDDELTLFHNVQDMVESKEVCLLSNSDFEEEIFEKMCSDINKNKWINNSGKDAPPPDFYSEELKLMFDIMMVNDNAFLNEKGKSINLQKKAESEVYKELQNSGLLEKLPNLDRIYMNISGVEETNEHHQYSRYKKEFNRIIQKHIDSVPLYKNNHPNYKLGFLIYDETQPYVELETCLYNIDYYKKIGRIPPVSKIHFPFLDKEFMSVFKNSGIDFIFWYMNNKMIRCKNEETGKIEEVLKNGFPKVVIIDLQNFDNIELLEYSEVKMISTNL